MDINARKLDINRFKELYVDRKIKDGMFSILPNDIADGEILKIKGFGTITINGYEHGFLYLKAGSRIKEHQHTKDIELYNIIKDGRIISSKVCLLNDFHGTDIVDEDTIIETFKLDKKVIKEVYDEGILNKYMLVQLDRYLWRLNKILNLLSMDNLDISWRSIDNISRVYNIPVDAIEAIYEVYFKNIKDIPYLSLSIDEIKEEINWNNIPYVIDDLYKTCDADEGNNKVLIKK